MGKKKNALAGVVVEAAPLSKKERRALAVREAVLAAELEARELREKLAAKKAKKKSKKAKPTDAEVVERAQSILFETPAEQAAADAKAARKAAREAAAKNPDEPGPQAIIDAAEKILADPNTPAETRADAETAREAATEADDAETDAQIRARVLAKREARARLDAMQAAGDERAAEVRDMAKALPEADSAEGVLNTRKPKTLSPEPIDMGRDITRDIQVAEVVETDHGREFAVGAATDDVVFAQPSEAPRLDFEQNGNGQYKVQRPSDGREVGYTRVTTYIDALEDKTMLTAWKMRVLLEGVAASEEPNADAFVTARVRDLAHNRDDAIAKARKADRKGKLAFGQLGTIVEGAWAEFKRGMDALADEAFEIGGGREKAAKGTDLHELAVLALREGIVAVGDKLTAGEITPQDLADVEAILGALEKIGAQIIDTERVIVNDELKVAGRLDIVAMVKLPAIVDPKTGEVIRAAEARGRRRVIDIKTGRVDYGTGKIAQQIEMYAGAIGYDLNTHEREDLKLDRTTGLLLHAPAGTGTATVHVVDLGVGRKGNKLAGEVRAFRNEGKRAIDLKVNVLDLIGGE